MESPGVNGYPSYKVGDSVTTHTAEGSASTAFSTTRCIADNAIETPTAAREIAMHHMMT